MTTNATIASMIAGCIAALAATTPASAENWVRVVDNPGGNATFFKVDVDSIKTEADGLIHFTEQDDWDTTHRALDCRNRISYITDAPMGMKGYNWKSSSRPIEAGSIRGEIADFVCARARLAAG